MFRLRQGDDQSEFFVAHGLFAIMNTIANTPVSWA
jgi:hypothetical protein